MSMFGTFSGNGYAAPMQQQQHPTYGPAFGDSGVEHHIGARGYDGGIHNSPFSEGRIKDRFSAPGPFNPFMFMRPRRRRLNVLSIVQVFSLPLMIFAMTTWLFGFSVHYTAPMWSWFFVAFCFVLFTVFMVKAVLVHKKMKQEMWTTPWYLLNDDDTWFLYLSLAIGISCLVGLCVGYIIYGSYMEPYYVLSNLHSYKGVDPVAEGKAYLDAGAIDFKNKSYVDIAKAVGYKDNVHYCAAPIKFGTDNVANYDFWAVGIECCTGFPGSFNCFEHREDTEAAGGLRVIDDANIPFFKLAVQQADAEWGKSSPNPIFVTWMRDPAAKINGYWSDALWTFWTSLVAFFIFEACIVLTVAYMYWKNRLWG